MQGVAQPWLVLSLTSSSFLVGFDAFAGHLPSMIFLIPGGILADRGDRKKIMITSQWVQLLSAALIAVGLAFGYSNVWLIIFLSFCVGTAQAFSFPAYQALVTSLIPKEHLANAISLNSLQFNVTRVIGPILAGAAMASVGATWCFALNSISFFALIIAIASMTSPFAGKQQTHPDQPREPLSHGFKRILSSKRQCGILLLVAISTAFCGPLSTFLPVLIRNTFAQGAAQFSISMAFFGGGALAGAFFIAANSSKLNIRFALVSSLLMGVLLTLISLAPQLWIVNLLLTLAGAAMVAISSAANTALQSTIENTFRARMASFFMLAIRGGYIIGNLATGFAIDRVGARWSLGMDGGITLLLTVLIWKKFLTQPETS